jgi:hypothetical protein
MHGSPSLFTLPPTLIMSYLGEVAEKHRESFTMKLFVERDPDVKNGVRQEAREDFASGRITKEHIEDILVERGVLQSAVEVSWWRSLLSRLDWRARSSHQPEPLTQTKHVFFLVCGPESYVYDTCGNRRSALTVMHNLSMIEAIAGPQSKTRADLERAGMLSELGYKAANVCRL